jgi:hypothetical protein
MWFHASVKTKIFTSYSTVHSKKNDELLRLNFNTKFAKFFRFQSLTDQKTAVCSSQSVQDKLQTIIHLKETN